MQDAVSKDWCRSFEDVKDRSKFYGPRFCLRGAAKKAFEV